MDTKIAIVFGGSGGIGRAVVDKLVTENVSVLCCDVTQGIELYTTNVRFFHCDVCKSEDVKKAFDTCVLKFGTLPQYVVNCVGIIDEFSWEKCVDINLNGSIRVLMSTLDRLGKHRGGSGGALVMLASILALDAGPNVPVYTATKHGILGLTRAWMHPVQAADHGVRITCICPTAVDTPLLQHSLRDRKMYKPELLAEMYDSFVSLSPEAVAENVVAFLLDDQAPSCVTRMSTTKGTETMEFPEHPIN